MAINPANFKAIFPEFAAQPDARVTLFQTMAENRISLKTLGTLYEDAVNFVTAHLLTRSKQGSYGGQVVGETVGGLSRQYGMHTRGGYQFSDYATTPYGMQYLSMLNLLCLTPDAL